MNARFDLYQEDSSLNAIEQLNKIQCDTSFLKQSLFLQYLRSVWKEIYQKFSGSFFNLNESIGNSLLNAISISIFKAKIIWWFVSQCDMWFNLGCNTEYFVHSYTDSKCVFYLLAL